MGYNYFLITERLCVETDSDETIFEAFTLYLSEKNLEDFTSHVESKILENLPLVSPDGHSQVEDLELAMSALDIKPISESEFNTISKNFEDIHLYPFGNSLILIHL